jgi:hypothetical protein
VTVDKADTVGFPPEALAPISGISLLIFSVVFNIVFIFVKIILLTALCLGFILNNLFLDYKPLLVLPQSLSELSINR